jgi:hypothetical protein
MPFGVQGPNFHQNLQGVLVLFVMVVPPVRHRRLLPRKRRGLFLGSFRYAGGKSDDHGKLLTLRWPRANESR